MHTRLSARLRLISAVMATAGLLLLLLPGTAGAQGGGFIEHKLVSDVPGVAANTDKNLVNSWGLSNDKTGGGGWVVSDNGTGKATGYTGVGTPFPLAPNAPQIITIPLPARSSASKAAPTGNVFNNSFRSGTPGFVVAKGSHSAASQFLFATEDGTISGWNPTVDRTHAILEVDNSAVTQGGFTGAVYKGLATGTSNGQNFLYATNFRFGTVEQFDDHFKLVKSFTDPKLAIDCPVAGPPAQCFAPFGVQNIGGNLFVTFALQDAAHHDDVKGPGNGFVDVFDTNGMLLRRLASGGTLNSPLNSPWGLALAPNTFGQFKNDLLVGNFGDGRINAFDLSGAFMGQLADENGNPITIDGLWGLAFGNDVNAGPSTTLFFASGPNGEADGLFGSITLA